jgi:hypothetical protein
VTLTGGGEEGRDEDRLAVAVVGCNVNVVQQWGGSQGQ